MKPHLFATCLVDALTPQVGRATLAALRAQGLDPQVPPKQVCCGQSLYKAGHVEASRRVAKAWVKAFAGSQVIISPSGSCVAHVRNHMAELLAPLPELAAQARDLAKRTFELSQYLHRVMGLTRLDGPGLSGDFTYHPSCGLHRALGEEVAPYALLDALAGGNRLELPDAERCCGFGGPFAVTHPELSRRLMEEKLARARSTGAPTLVVGDVGCFLHLKTGNQRLGGDMKVIHLAQALATRTGDGS